MTGRPAPPRDLAGRWLTKFFTDHLAGERAACPRTVSSYRDAMKLLLADEYNGKKIDRFELPELHAVHFLLHDHLDRGVSCSSTYDFLGKNVAEFLRSRHVDLPNKFLNRGKL